MSTALQMRFAGVIVAGVGGVLFVLSGYLASDSRYADSLMVRYMLHTADEFSCYFSQRKRQQPPGSCVASGQSFWPLVERPGHLFYCYEAAVVLAAFAWGVGAQTRIISRASGSFGLSHYLALQVGRDGNWTTYDFAHGRQGMVPEGALDNPVMPQYRSCPEWIHRVMLAYA